jgi:tRNA threonylcarbamoyladenosine biosynthesis protein TsaE
VGELGAGKTCFAQGVGEGLGIGTAITSPTFIRVREYLESSARLLFYHIDLYRVTDSVDAMEWGLEEYLYGDGVCVIEWAERIRALLPPSCLWIYFDYGEASGARHIKVCAEGDRGRWLLAQLTGTVCGA